MAYVVTRFAPSPTGFLHVGGLRTALFSYLWARKNKGEFRLRIEDTDSKRQVPGADTQMVSVLRSFGLDFDGTIVYQSERASRGVYREHAERLIHENKAYYCFCTPRRLEVLRKEQAERKQPPGYDGMCRNVSRDAAVLRMKHSESATVRLRWPREDLGETLVFDDGLRGKVTFKVSALEDAILLKSDGFPTYHLASVIDDHEMKVTHVIRAEEWLPSAPIHDRLYENFGFKKPKFWHLPLILNADKAKLSKRRGDATVEQFLKKGYLKEALINYVAFLGWNPGEQRELFSLDELVERFDLRKLNRSGAIFSIDKLNWFNSMYIRNNLAPKSNDEIYSAVRDYVPQLDKVRAVQLFNLFFERIHALSDLADVSSLLFSPPVYDAQLLIYKKSSLPAATRGLMTAQKTLQAHAGEWTAVTLAVILEDAQKSNGLAAGDLFWPVRVALSGQSASPPPQELLAFLGKEESIQRLDHSIKMLEKINK